MSGLTSHTPLDRALSVLATRQHGVVSLSQLRCLGLEKNAVTERVRAGRLHPVHRGVYSVGHRLLSTHGRWMAAVLACGEGAVLSHRDAARLWGLQLRPGGRLIDVTSRTRAGRRRDGIVVHAGRTLTDADVTTVDGIPCTAVPRTLLDHAEVARRAEVEKAVERAVTLGLFDLAATHELLARSKGRRGAPRLKRAIAAYDDTPTRSDLERAFLKICKRAGIPGPEVNVLVDVYEVDFLWRTHELIIEADGHETHGTRTAIERDHKRDRRLRKLGWQVERFTWREIVHGPRAVEADLKQLLSAAA